MPHQSHSPNMIRARPCFWFKDHHYVNKTPNLEDFCETNRFCVARPGIKGAKSARFIACLNNFGENGGFEHLLMAIGTCASPELLMKLLRLISRPLEMYVSEWAMSYISQMFNILERGFVEALPEQMKISEWNKHQNEFSSFV